MSIDGEVLRPKPCPTCGSHEPVVEKTTVEGCQGYYVRCWCGMRTKVFFERDHNEQSALCVMAAVELWNHEPPADETTVANDGPPTLEQVAEQAEAAFAGKPFAYVMLAWEPAENGQQRRFYTAHSFQSWQDAALPIQHTVNFMLTEEKRKAGKQIILPSGAGHPRGLPNIKRRN